MKVAVLISGLLRSFPQTWPLMQRYFVDRYKPDIYVYLNEPQKQELVTELLTPTVMLVEPDPILPEYDYHTRFGPGNSIVQNDLRQMYGLMKVNELRRQVPVEYDWVFRVRPDMEMIGGLEAVEALDPSFIYVPRFSNWWGYCDKFAFGPPGLMDIYMERFEALHAYFQRGGAFHMETYLEWYLRQRKAPVARTNTVFNLLRENGERDLTWWNEDLGDVRFPPEALAAMSAAGRVGVQSDAGGMAEPGTYSRQPIFAQGKFPTGALTVVFGDPAVTAQKIEQVCIKETGGS